jgi:hypothetical protein
MKILSKKNISSCCMHKLILFRSHFLPPPIQIHIDRLYEQIDDLVLQLSDERLRHKQTRIRVFY